MTIKDLSTDQLQKIISLKEQIEDLQSQIDSITGGVKRGRPPGKSKGKRKMSAAGRARIAAAAKARWAKYRGEKADKPVMAKRKMSAASRAKIAAAAKARWKKAKAEGKTTL